MSSLEPLRVEVVCCSGPGRIECVELSLPAGATVGDALRTSGLLGQLGIEPQAALVGVWGRRQPLEAPLRERDRVEVYRPLLCDPKEARRLRYRQRGKVSGNRSR